MQLDSGQDYSQQDRTKQDPVSRFDSCYTTRHLQMLKILFACVEPRFRGVLAVYIRLMELQVTLSMTRRDSPLSVDGFPGQNESAPPSFSDLCAQLCPLCSETERKGLKKMQEMSENIKNMQEMLQMVEMMRELFPENEQNPASSGGDSSAFLAGLSSIFGGSGEMNNQDMEKMQQILSMLMTK